MNIQIILAILLSFLPFIELRGGMPVIIDYALKNNLSIFPYFILIILVNIAIIPVAFFFMDFIHIHLVKIKLYKKFIEKIIERTKRKGKHLENKKGIMLHIFLSLFVAVPLPGTGAWAGSLIAWIFGLDKKKSFLSISLGVILAGIAILLLSLIALGFIY